MDLGIILGIIGIVISIIGQKTLFKFKFCLNKCINKLPWSAIFDENLSAKDLKYLIDLIDSFYQNPNHLEDMEIKSPIIICGKNGFISDNIKNIANAGYLIRIWQPEIYALDINLNSEYYLYSDELCLFLANKHLDKSHHYGIYKFIG